MRIIAIIENTQADPNGIFVGRWLETKSFDDSDTLKDVITWATKSTGSDLCYINIKLAVDQSSIEKK